MGIEMVSVAAIVVLCYLIGQIVKASGIDNKWIPITCGLSGGIIGVIAMYVMPDYPATDWINACAIGIVSGLGATGLNQSFKQLTSK